MTPASIADRMTDVCDGLAEAREREFARCADEEERESVRRRYDAIFTAAGEIFHSHERLRRLIRSIYESAPAIYDGRVLDGYDAASWANLLESCSQEIRR